MSLQAEIIDRLGVKPNINAQEEIRHSIDFIKAYFNTHSFLRTAVLGISGGQDSTLVGKLVQMAMEELRAETSDDRYEFIAVKLPYGQQKDADDVEFALEWIGPDKIFSVNIKEAVDQTVDSLEANGITISDFNKGNIKARQRMISQYAIAGDLSGIVVGTDHAAENVVGFFTKYGDGGADIIPIHRLNKRQGKHLLEALDAPERLIVKEPTADLEDNKPMMPDEVALGVSYEEVDDYLEGKKVNDDVRKRIEGHYRSSEHKRHMPITTKDNFWQK